MQVIKVFSKKLGCKIAIQSLSPSFGESILDRSLFSWSWNNSDNWSNNWGTWGNASAKWSNNWGKWVDSSKWSNSWGKWKDSSSWSNSSDKRWANGGSHWSNGGK